MELGRVCFIIFFCTFYNTAAEEDILKHDEEICFPILGCFSMRPPWKSLERPIPEPMKPEEVGTRVYFYSKAQPEKRYEIPLRPEVHENGAPLNRSKPTVFIIHGFMNSGNDSWLSDMKDAYLNRVDANVMLVDWGPGAKKLNYLQVTSNIRIVARELKRLIQSLIIDPKTIHLIGHSLGAQTAAYVGKAIPGIARITALDPAQPGFEGYVPMVRLNASDAKFIDVIHTNSRPTVPTLGFGMIGAVGTTDFYLNGGPDQPGCPIPDVSQLSNITSLQDFALVSIEALANIVPCAHGRSHIYYTEALSNRNCVFLGHKASVANELRSLANTVTQGSATRLTALSSDCSPDDCTPMGLDAISGLRGVFVVTTNGQAPFCISEPGISLGDRERLPLIPTDNLVPERS